MAVLVYDITLWESFDSMENSWFKQLRYNAPQDIVIRVTGNKSDLYDDEVVSEQEERDFAKEIWEVFPLTSAQINSWIDELFKNLAKKYIHIDININVEQEGKWTNTKTSTKRRAESRTK